METLHTVHDAYKWRFETKHILEETWHLQHQQKSCPSSMQEQNTSRRIHRLLHLWILVCRPSRQYSSPQSQTSPPPSVACTSSAHALRHHDHRLRVSCNSLPVQAASRALARSVGCLPQLASPASGIGVARRSFSLASKALRRNNPETEACPNVFPHLKPPCHRAPTPRAPYVLSGRGPSVSGQPASRRMQTASRLSELPWRRAAAQTGLANHV